MSKWFWYIWASVNYMIQMTYTLFEGRWRSRYRSETCNISKDEDASHHSILFRKYVEWGIWLTTSYIIKKIICNYELEHWSTYFAYMILQFNIFSCRFFFVVEESASAISLIVTPCSSRISWMFSYLYPTPNEDQDEDHDEDQGRSIHGTEQKISQLLKMSNFMRNNEF